MCLVFDWNVWGGSHEITVLDSSGVIRRIIERSDSEEEEVAEDVEEESRLAQAIALSLTSPMPASQPIRPKAARAVRFNLPLLDPPPRHVPVIPRLRSVRFRPPPPSYHPKTRPSTSSDSYTAHDRYDAVLPRIRPTAFRFKSIGDHDYGFDLFA